MKLSWANGLRGIAALALLTGRAGARTSAARDSHGEVAKEEPKIVAIRIVKEKWPVLSDAPSGIAVETGTRWIEEKSRKVCARFTGWGTTRTCRQS